MLKDIMIVILFYLAKLSGREGMPAGFRADEDITDNELMGVPEGFCRVVLHVSHGVVSQLSVGGVGGLYTVEEVVRTLADGVGGLTETDRLVDDGRDVHKFSFEVCW